MTNWAYTSMRMCSSSVVKCIMNSTSSHACIATDCYNPLQFLCLCCRNTSVAVQQTVCRKAFYSWRTCVTPSASLCHRLESPKTHWTFHWGHACARRHQRQPRASARSCHPTVYWKGLPNPKQRYVQTGGSESQHQSVSTEMKKVLQAVFTTVTLDDINNNLTPPAVDFKLLSHINIFMSDTLVSFIGIFFIGLVTPLVQATYFFKIMV